VGNQEKRYFDGVLPRHSRVPRSEEVPKPTRVHHPFDNDPRFGPPKPAFVHRCDRCHAPLAVVGFQSGSEVELACLHCFGRFLLSAPSGRTQQPSGSPVAQTFLSADKAYLARRQRQTASGTVRALSASVYAEVRLSGPCVYCGEPSATADHIWPLSRGGPDVRENLVPACWKCNNDKRAQFLTEWDPDRVARAVGISPLVAAELQRLRALPEVPSASE
jgi:hypothetical protein